jgi:starvation-inducible DNA-binding protein
LTLGHSPEHKYSVYQKQSNVEESNQVSDGLQAVKEILAAFKAIILLQRDLLDLSEEANDEGTNALMSDYIRSQEKMVWMYSAYLA